MLTPYMCNVHGAHLFTNIGDDDDFTGDPCPLCPPDEPGDLIPVRYAQVIAAMGDDTIRVMFDVLRQPFARYALRVMTDRAHEAEQARQIDEYAAMIQSAVLYGPRVTDRAL